MTTNTPIRVGGQPLPDSVIQGTTRSPIVVTPQEGDSGDTTPRLGYNQPTYKVKLTSNGKVFNMLLPPSIETKHPGKSNPMQMPGLQIEASAAISKLKIPGFFPIYQHLGVETLTVSMSGMFTGYDGTSTLAAASEWEGWKDLTIREGQDSYSAANELYEFAVRNKSLIEVIIYTSDGSFTPKKSTATTFRDEQSNIRFKGYIKDFKQIYVRQDRNYYMLKFEIIDLTTGTNTCKSDVKSNKSKTNKTDTSVTTTGLKLPTSTIKAIDTLGNTPEQKKILKDYNNLSDTRFINDLLFKRGFMEYNPPPDSDYLTKALIKASEFYIGIKDLSDIYDGLTNDTFINASYNNYATDSSKKGNTNTTSTQPATKNPITTTPTPVKSLQSQIESAKKTLNIPTIEIFSNGGNLIIPKVSAVDTDKVIDTPFLGNINKDVTVTYIGNNFENYPLYKLEGTAVKKNKVVLKRTLFGFELLPSE